MSATIQRPLRGSRISSFYPVKNLPSLASLDSAFQLQEYISLLIRLDVHDVDTIVAVPGKTEAPKDGKEQAEDSDKKNDVSVDEACWIYEQLRRLAQDLSHPLITMLQQECNRSSCPEMKAGEWLYLCVAHGNDAGMEQCCAIDYILHTLDSATALLNSPRAFPSRLQIPQTSHRHFSSLARRLGRIFAHAYFHHREVFEQAEAESSLYARFLALTSKFDLVPAEFLVIPPRLLHQDGDGRDIDVDPPRLLAAGVEPTILKADTPASQVVDEPTNLPEQPESPSGSGNSSPRKMGRNRTDTMVFSDTFTVQSEDSKKEDEIPSSSNDHVPDAEEQGQPETETSTNQPLAEMDVTAQTEELPTNFVTPSSSTAPQDTPSSIAVTEEETTEPPEVQPETLVAEETVPVVEPTESSAPVEQPPPPPQTESAADADSKAPESAEVEGQPVSEPETSAPAQSDQKEPATLAADGPPAVDAPVTVQEEKAAEEKA